MSEDNSTLWNTALPLPEVTLASMLKASKQFEDKRKDWESEAAVLARKFGWVDMPMPEIKPDLKRVHIGLMDERRCWFRRDASKPFGCDGMYTIDEVVQFMAKEAYDEMNSSSANIDRQEEQDEI